jgi:ribonuclease BN (tRNA processing enzyme)
MMRVTFLGGSAAGANTGMPCTGLLVRTATTTALLDLGPGVFPELRRHVDFRELDGIVISHLHLDHTLDLGTMRYALAYNPRPGHRRIPLWMPPDGRAFLERYAAVYADPGDLDTFFSAVFDIGDYRDDSVVRIGDITVRFHPTVHYRPCWAMRLSAPGSGDLLFTADLGPASDLAAFARGVGLVIVESGTLDGDREPFATRGHLTPEEAAHIALDAGAPTMALSHLWEEHGFTTYRRRAAAVFPGELHVASPGLTLEVPPR